MEENRYAVFGRWGPRRPRLARWCGRAALPVTERIFAHYGLHRPHSGPARRRLLALGQAIRAGRESYVLGFNSGTHNSGAALVRVTEQGTVELVCNEEEERYTAVKHCHDYPEQSLETIKQRMRALGVEAKDLAACVICWDYPTVVNTDIVHPILEEAPASLNLLSGVSMLKHPTINQGNLTALLHSSRRLGEQLGLGGPVPIVGMGHHDSHAYLSYGVSPFAAGTDQTMVIVIDGGGDNACTSLYASHGDELTLLSPRIVNQLESLGRMYSVLSSTQGGWPELSSEGRYMGAAAWGDGKRLTNHYYRRLRQIFYFGADGVVRLNRELANWTRSSWGEPYTAELRDILGEPIGLEEMWHPDAVLNVEDVRHPQITRERVDKAAAVQMVFEDALTHIVDYLIRATGSSRLVLRAGRR